MPNPGIFTTNEWSARHTRVLLDGQPVGLVTRRSPKSFRASRRNGEVGVDIRRVTTVRSFDAALAWICKQSPDAVWNAPLTDERVL